MIWMNRFVNNSIACNAAHEVDLDRLNLLASGENQSLCSCAYQTAGKHHLFVYQTGGMTPIKLQQIAFSDVVAMLGSLRPLLEPGVLQLEQLRLSRDCIFRDGSRYRFVYVPMLSQKTVPARDVLSKLVSLTRLKDERLTAFSKELKGCRDDGQAIASLERFLQAWGSESWEEEAETTLLSQPDDELAAEAETTLLSAAEEEAETTLLSSDGAQEELPLQEELEAVLSKEVHTMFMDSSEGETTVLGPETLPEDDEFHFSEHPGLTASRVTAFLYGDTENNETTLLTSEPPVVKREAVHRCSGNEALFLIRSSTGERIHIDTTPFTIGKDIETVDYLVDNQSVSRRHATIFYDQDHYYIMDERSTNGTVVEGIQLRPMEKMELGNGYLISLGSEFFQTRIERR